MKGLIESAHGDTIRVSKELSSNQYIRVQMNETGFAYLDYAGIEKLQMELETAKRRLFKRQENDAKKSLKFSQGCLPFD